MDAMDAMDAMEPPEIRDFSAEEIRAIVVEASQTIGAPDARLGQMRCKYPDFWYRYPKLLDMSCQDNFDMRYLEYMLNMFASVRANKTTLKDASKEVQARLATDYLPKHLQEQQGSQETAAAVSAGERLDKN